MNSFVLDCSATVGICFGDQPQDYYLAVLERLRRGDEAIVPPLWHYELANSLLIGKRKKKISPQIIPEFAKTLCSFRINTINPDWNYYLANIEDDIYLAFANDLTVYDAHYLALAIQSGLPLATTDLALRMASRAVNVTEAITP